MKLFILLSLIISSLFSFGVKAQTFYSQLADQYAAEGNYEKALELEKEGLEMWERIHGKENLQYTQSLTQLAEFYYYVGKLKEAKDTGDKVLLIKKSILDENDYEYALSLNNNSQYYAALGLYSDAINLCLYASKIFLNKGKFYPEHCFSLINLGTYYSYLGDLHAALKFLQEALNYMDPNNYEQRITYGKCLNNMGAIFAKLGNYEEAIGYWYQANDIFKSDLKIGDLTYLKSLDNIAISYKYQGNYKKAFEIEKKILNDKLNLLGETHPDYWQSLHNLATFYGDINDYDEAVRLISLSLSLQAQYQDKNNVDYALKLSNRAGFYAKMYDYGKAIIDEKEAYNITKHLFKPQSPNLINSLRRLTTSYYQIGDEKNLILSTNEVLPLLKSNLLNNFAFLISSERNKFINKHWGNWVNVLYPRFIFKFAPFLKISDAFDMVLLSKGILLNSEMEFDKFLAETGDEALLEKYNQIKSLRLQLNKLYEKPIAERYVDTDSLERQANELERQLMQESAEFGDYTRNLAITWEDVRDNLKEKDAAIEFLHFSLNSDSTMYMAYVLRHGMEAPELVKLFEEKDLTSLIVEDDKASIYTDKSASELIWGKLNPQLEGVDNVYFSPDGVLHQIAIEYLPDLDGEGMISDRFNLHRLSSTREIALNRHNAPTKEAVVYGGIKYDTDVATMETESRKYERPKNRGFSPYYNLGDSLALRGSLEYLDGSFTEAENITGMMKENNYSSTLLSGNDATEESFKSLSGKANGIIHISTHGFYWTESEAERKASLNDRLMFMSQLGDNARRNVEDKALTRTGLFMAGAKNALGGVELPEDVDDGILTAQEIANLDLRGLDLVVLSACQTGMGDISGDGVFGLQRGFKKAGANTILMSLWDVSDEATQILMTNFYKNYLGGMSKQQALREAQKKVREIPGFSDPEYWAAFILLDGLN